MAKKPRKKRMMGEEPARGLISPNTNEAPKAPNRMPGISGLRY
jgi:hypothetical protein